MIHLINFIIKVLATAILFLPLGMCLMLLALVFWDFEYIKIGDTIYCKLWE